MKLVKFFPQAINSEEMCLGKTFSQEGCSNLSPFLTLESLQKFSSVVFVDRSRVRIVIFMCPEDVSGIA